MQAMAMRSMPALGAQALAREVERMVRRNFEEEAERIVDALERDLIQPMDF